MHIDIWSDIACPWCYLGLTRFRVALDGFAPAAAVEVRLRSFQLDPGLPESFDGTEFDYLATAKGIPVEQARHMTAQVAAAAEPDGLRFDFDALAVANSRRAHRLVQWARHSDPSGQTAWRLELLLFAAHFADGQSIWEPAVLVRLATEAGLEAESARAALEDAELDAEVAADIAQARAWGIQGLPYFVFEEKYAISGAQPVEVFTAALEQVWTELNPAPAPATSPSGMSG